MVMQSSRDPESQRQRVLQEVSATRLLQGHPHAVRLIDVYEDAKSYHIIMEMLAGACWRVLPFMSIW